MPPATEMHPVLVLLSLLAILVVYLAPALIAFWRGHQSRWAIALVDVLLGWTVVGWFVALLWSLTGVWRRAAA